MQQRDLVVGFSELKDLLIRTYRIERSREDIKLHFSSDQTGILWMHDYHEHHHVVMLSWSVRSQKVLNSVRGYARKVVEFALTQTDPVEYLNEEFQLHGYFKP